MICLSNLPFVTIILRLLSLLKTIRWRNESQWVIPTCRSSVALHNTWLAFHFVFIRQWYHKYFKTRYVCTYIRTDVSMYVCIYVCMHVCMYVCMYAQHVYVCVHVLLNKWSYYDYDYNNCFLILIMKHYLYFK